MVRVSRKIFFFFLLSSYTYSNFESRIVKICQIVIDLIGILTFVHVFIIIRMYSVENLIAKHTVIQ